MAVHRRAIDRVPAALLAALWMVAPSLGMIHGLEHQHHFCADHGEFEESLGQAGPADVPGSTESNVRPAGVQDSRQHEVCAFAQLLRRDASTGRERTWAVIAVIRHADAPRLESVAILSPIPLLATAPKSSPPVARA